MTKNVFIPLALVCLLAASVCSCQKDPVETLADQIWEYALKNPEGFNLDINTMTEPAEGVAASYEGTQRAYVRETLPEVIKHAQGHDGYVCGWLDKESGLYIFGSDKLFPESRLEEAKAFGRANKQEEIFIISKSMVLNVNKKLLVADFTEEEHADLVFNYEYDALGRLTKVSSSATGDISYVLHEVYTYGENTITMTAYDETVAPENATDRQEYHLNKDGLIDSWTQTKLENGASAQYECRYDEQKHLVRVLDADNSAESISILWENGEMVSAQNLNNSYTYTPSTTPFTGYYPHIFLPGLLLLNDALANLGYFGNFGQFLPAALEIKTGTLVTTNHRFTYEMSGGILTGFVDVSHTIVKTIVTDIETEYTYPHRLEWKDI